MPLVRAYPFPAEIGPRYKYEGSHLGLATVSLFLKSFENRIMAATFVTVRPAGGILACATSGHRKPDQDLRRNSSSANWWAPIFGFSSEPDYIDSKKKPSEEKPESKASRARFAGCFTEDKAKQLRRMTMGTESFHDTMYHSGIASRLASDFKASFDDADP